MTSTWRAACLTAMILGCGPTGVGPRDGGGDEDGSGGDGAPVADAGPIVGAFPVDDPGADGAWVDPALPESVVGDFGGPETTSGAPRIVYPLDGSMHARNLGDITFQWRRGSDSHAVFRIDVAGGGQNYRFYLPCDQAECTYQLPEDEWLALGTHYAGSQVSVAIAGTDGAGGDVATDGTMTLHYSPEDVGGALYYWASKQREIKRATFGADEAVPFIVPGQSADYDCVACHSVSRDGKVIAFAVAPEQGEDIAAIQTAPTDDPSNPFVAPPSGPTPFPPSLTAGNTTGPTDYFGHNVALSPDGSIAAINGIPVDPPNWPPYLELRDTRTGATLGKWDAGDPLFGAEKLGILPEWSPSGDALVVALADGTGDGPSFGCLWTSDTCRSSIAVLPFDGTTLQPARVVVPNDGYDFHFYPTWSPDGAWIAFASATWDPANPNQKSLSNPNALLRLVRSTGGPYACPGPDCVELERGAQYGPSEASAGLGKMSTWPKFTPFTQGPGDSVMFISFNTQLDYGFLASGVTQIWMFAVDVAAIASGEDPSFAPVWLPYQDVDDGSLTPYWTETLPCTLDDEGCEGCVDAERCQVDNNGECYCAVIE